MTFSYVGRLGMNFWLEAILAACALMLFGYLTAGEAEMLIFTLAVSLPFIIGGWLYRAGGQNTLLHLLLYPLLAGVAVLGFYWFDSFLIALLLAGGIYWRIHELSQDIFHFDNLLKRFIFAYGICLTHLALASMFLPSDAESPFDPQAFYGMFVVILASYLVLNACLYMVHVQIPHGRPPVRIRLTLSVQWLLSRALLVSGYLLGGYSLLWLLSTLWNWMKGPLGDLVNALFAPILQMLSDWTEGLAGLFSKNRNIENMLNNQENGAELPYEELQGTGEPLFTALEPYLIAALVLLAAILLARYIWKRRNSLKAGENSPTLPVMQTTLSELEPLETEPEQPMLDLQTFFQGRRGPSEEPVRYAYYQFLKHMSGQGIPMHRYETTQEYLKRLRHQLQDSEQIQLAEQITRFYEQYRYQEHSLSDSDLEAMQEAVRKLLETSPPPRT